MTQAQKKQKRKEYQRKWYLKSRQKQKALKEVVAPETETIPLINIINAYYVLHSATTDGQIRADLNKVLSSIIAKQ